MDNPILVGILVVILLTGMGIGAVTVSEFTGSDEGEGEHDGAGASEGATHWNNETYWNNETSWNNESYWDNDTFWNNESYWDNETFWNNESNTYNNPEWNNESSYDNDTYWNNETYYHNETHYQNVTIEEPDKYRPGENSSIYIERSGDMEHNDGFSVLQFSGYVNKTGNTITVNGTYQDNNYYTFIFYEENGLFWKDSFLIPWNDDKKVDFNFTLTLPFEPYMFVLIDEYDVERECFTVARVF